MVQTSPIYEPDDATDLIADLRANVDSNTEIRNQIRIQQEKDHAWLLAAGTQHPMPRPAGHTPFKDRWAPFSSQPAQV